jgi:hypothetical protein
MSRFGFTEHAVDRFIERHAPDLSREEARRYLEQSVLKAVRLKEKTYNGETQWQIEDGIVLVTKVDNREIVCVTVLPEPRQPRGPSEEELELMQEYASRTLLDPVPVSIPKLKQHEKPPIVQVVSRSERGAAETFFEMALSDKALKRLLHVAQLEASKLRQREKTRRHHDHQALEVSKLRALLRAAMRGLTELEGGAQYLEEMKAIEEDFNANREVKRAS